MKQSCCITLLCLTAIITTVPGIHAQDEPALDPTVADILGRMADLLAEAERYRFTAELTYDNYLTEDSFIQSAWTTEFVIRRPDRLFVSYNLLEPEKYFFYDGMSWTIHYLEKGMFSSVPMPPSIDEALDTILYEYGIILPISDLVYSDPFEVLTSTVQKSYYAGQQRVRGVVCHHLVFQEEDIGWQIWIEAGGRPLPHKYVITYWDLDGAPQVTAFFDEWDFATPAPDAIFQIGTTDDLTEIGVMTVQQQADLEGVE